MEKLTHFVLIVVLLSLVCSSCSDDEMVSNNSQEERTFLKWDESSHPFSSRSGNQNEAYEFVPDGITSGAYLGMILYGASISNPPIRVLSGISLDSIDVVFDMPGYYSTRIYPRIRNYTQALNNALHADGFSGKQTEQFEYDLKQFSDYRELRLAFGTNVNIANIFKGSIDVNDYKIHYKTGLFARVYQRNFAAQMDYPEDGCILKDNSNVTYNQDAYVNSIIYGRLAIIAIESDSSYNSVKAAFKASLNIGKWGGDAQLDENYKRILMNADVHVYILGGDGRSTAQTFEGFSKFEDFIINGGEFSAEVPGVPIYITANHINDNSAWITHFSTSE